MPRPGRCWPRSTAGSAKVSTRPTCAKPPRSSTAAPPTQRRSSRSGRRVGGRAVDRAGPGFEKGTSMASEEPPEYGTLVTAALLILALAFAGYWIYTYVGDTGQPLAPWFAVAAVGIVVVAILNYVFTGRSSSRER